jgi:zinc protease
LNSGIPGRSASELCDLWAHRLPDDAHEELSKVMRQATPDGVTKIFSEHARPGHAIIVVAGDAASVGPLLQPFGEVKIVDPTQNFARVRTLPPKG